MSAYKNRFQRSLRGIICFLIGLFLAFGGGEMSKMAHFKVNLGLMPVNAQLVNAERLASQVYEQLSEFPLENQYVNKETGQVESENTLVSRLIRYHLSLKRRPPNFRLDWKLTLADYLGANEPLTPSEYPGNNTLQENPLEGDRAIINNLTREQRNELIQVIVSLFNPNAATPPTASPTPSPTSSPTPTPRATPSLPQPGDADLLKF